MTACGSGCRTASTSRSQALTSSGVAAANGRTTARTKAIANVRGPRLDMREGLDDGEARRTARREEGREQHRAHHHRQTEQVGARIETHVDGYAHGRPRRGRQDDPGGVQGGPDGEGCLLYTSP